MKKFFSLIITFLISACAVNLHEPVKQYDIVFKEEVPLVLDARVLQIKVLYEPPFKSPNIEHLMPFPLERALRSWLDANVTVSGDGNNTALFVIKEASVTEDIVGESLIKGGSQEIYQANVKVSLSIIDEKGKKTEAVATSWQHYTSSKEMTVEEREDAWFSMVKTITEDAGNKLKETIQEFLSDYIM